MQLYDVVAGGHRTALTRTQIAGLFQAGQLSHNDPCKAADQAEWRTIDDMFPLLKEGTLARSLYQPTQLHKPRPHVLALTAVISVLVISAASIVAYFFWLNGSGSRNRISVAAAANPQAPAAYKMENPYWVSRKTRAEEERINAAQKARTQAQLARIAQERAEAERREQELQKAAGRTERILLDQFQVVHDVDGSDVRVKIHDDNKAETFDVWINGNRRRQVTRQKATGSGQTDETLIYRKGNTRLYYLREGSGNQSRGLLRVRDE